MKIYAILIALVTALVLAVPAQATQVTWSVGGCAGALSDPYLLDATHIQVQTSIFGDVSTGICHDGSYPTYVRSEVWYCRVGSDDICDTQILRLAQSTNQFYNNGAHTFYLVFTPTLVSANVTYGYWADTLMQYENVCVCGVAEQGGQTPRPLRVKLKPAS